MAARQHLSIQLMKCISKTTSLRYGFGKMPRCQLITQFHSLSCPYFHTFICAVFIYMLSFPVILCHVHRYFPTKLPCARCWKHRRMNASTTTRVPTNRISCTSTRSVFICPFSHSNTLVAVASIHNTHKHTPLLHICSLRKFFQVYRATSRLIFQNPGAPRRSTRWWSACATSSAGLSFYKWTTIRTCQCSIGVTILNISILRSVCGQARAHARENEGLGRDCV